MKQDKDELTFGSALFQNIFGIVRVLLAFYILIFFASTYSMLFHAISPVELALKLRDTNPFFENFPPVLLVIFASLIDGYVFRYILAPLLAMVCAISLAGFYIKDVYALPTLSSAIHYVIASLFTIAYPQMKVDKGVKQQKKGELNLIDRIGGPGSISIEPGSAAIFRHLRGQSGSLIAGTYFLKPFEQIAHTVDLVEQQGDKDQIDCMTRDGIKVQLRDIHYRYRIKANNNNGTPARRDIKNPYPFAEDALINLTYNLSVAKLGLESWNVAVDRSIIGQITDFVAEHSIDYLTAPREKDMWPREELLDFLKKKSAMPLNSLGAELLWADVGHIEIVEELVDQQRTSLWAADWVGNATVSRAYGEAKRLAYQEMGRAEAQAELIISIADALSAANPGENTTDNVRKLMLARTAQVLDAINSKQNTNPGTRL